MGIRVCTVSFTSQTGITHSVDVEATTVYEAAAIGFARLQQGDWVEGLGPATRLEIQVRERATHHVVSVQHLQRWMNSVTTSPADLLRKTKLKQLLKT